TRALAVDFDARDFRTQIPEGAIYRLPTAKVENKRFFSDLERDLKARLRREQSIELLKNDALKLYSRPGESEEEFNERCREAAMAEADRAAAKLRDSFNGKMDRVRVAMARAEDRIEQYQEDTKTRRGQEVVSGLSD